MKPASRIVAHSFPQHRWKRHPFAGGTKAKDTADSGTARRNRRRRVAQKNQDTFLGKKTKNVEP